MTARAAAAAASPSTKSPVAEHIIRGKGVHTGAEGAVRFVHRADANRTSGIRFNFPGCGFLAPAQLGRLSKHALRATVLEYPSDIAPAGRIRTPEHLLAALLFFSDLPLDVECDGPEIPGLDGSALPFREMLSGFEVTRKLPSWEEYPCDFSREWKWDGGFLRARPSDRFRVSFELERESLKQTFALENAATAWREILPARSFVFYREWDEAVKNGSGLMAGADIDSGLLLAETEAEYKALLADHPDWKGGPYPLLNHPEWRMDAEPVKHKILDLLGDLALLGLKLPRLELEIRNGGHRANHLLLDAIIASSA